MRLVRISRHIAWVVVLALVMGACSPKGAGENALEPTQAEQAQASPTAVPTSTLEPTAAPTAAPGFSLWVSPAVPDGLKKSIRMPERVNLVEDAADAFRLEPGASAGDGRSEVFTSTWVYALVAPFPTIADGASLADIKDAWQGKTASGLSGHPLLVTTSTKATMESLLGPASSQTVSVLPAEQILDAAWKDLNSWAIVPFEELAPRWKVIRVDGQSPYDKKFDAAQYPLAVQFRLSGPTGRATAFQALAGKEAPLGLVATNRDASKLTVVAMTGVTALVRAIANKMDTKGVTYPGRDIGDWLREADIAHVSNEVSFDPNCPLGNPSQISLQFCSRPEYIGLLSDVGIDVVELSGNHLNDWSRKALMYTLNLYDMYHIQYFAGGRNLEEARKPLLFEDHGNKIAFIGCNPPGPDYDWATETGAGAAPCDDLAWEVSEIQQLRAQGYLPIATFQYNESYSYIPMPWQLRDFRKVSEAGAVVVSGSQAHFPQTLEFDNGNLIHYGLGNMFFDQMAPIIDGRRIYGTEREFVDRHIFYDGRYLGTELLTAMLEDYSKPRPMTAEERQSLLTDVFTASGWVKKEE